MSIIEIMVWATLAVIGGLLASSISITLAIEVFSVITIIALIPNAKIIITYLISFDIGVLIVVLMRSTVTIG
jgi:hypothetical protein